MNCDINAGKSYVTRLKDVEYEDSSVITNGMTHRLLSERGTKEGSEWRHLPGDSRADFCRRRNPPIALRKTGKSPTATANIIADNEKLKYAPTFSNSWWRFIHQARARLHTGQDFKHKAYDNL